MFLNDGSTNALMELLRVLSKEGNDFLIIYSRKSDRLAELNMQGIQTVRIPYLRSSDRGYAGIIRIAYLAILSIINAVALLRMFIVSRSFKPQLVHTNVSPIHLGYYLSKILKVPHIWHLREFRRREDKSQPVFSYDNFLRLLKDSHSIATTKSIKDFYDLSDCRVIYDGVIKNAATEKLSPLEARTNSFLFVGRVEKSKGIELLIESFALFSREHEEWKLDVVGAGSDSYLMELKKRIHELGIGGKVNFYGACSDVNAKMRERKVVVISSFSEGFGYVTVEAMNNKCFVIANDNTGTKEQLDNARDIMGHDVAYRFTDSEELLNQMKRFVNEDYARLQAKVDEAYNVVNSLYGVDRYASDVLNYYKSL